MATGTAINGQVQILRGFALTMETGHSTTDRPGRPPGKLRPISWGQIQVEWTSRCNLRCRTCLYPAYEHRWMQQDLSAEAFRQLLDAAPRCDSIHLQGWGESLLRQDISGCIRKLSSGGTKPTLGSNGSHMTPDLAQELMDAGLHSMTFSLAGPDARSHDLLRGRGSFMQTVKSIETFTDRRPAAAKPAVLINYLLTPYSYPRLPKALALCSRLGADTLVATHLVHACTEAQKSLVSYGTGHLHRWALFRSRLSVLWRHIGLVLPGIKESPMPICPKNPLENAFVGADGAVSPCVYLCPPIHGQYAGCTSAGNAPLERLVMGNLEKDSLEEIWVRKEYAEFRKAFQRRLAFYEDIMPPVRTDFDGLTQLEQATNRISAAFASPDHMPPAPCRGCPHLLGY